MSSLTSIYVDAYWLYGAKQFWSGIERLVLVIAIRWIVDCFFGRFVVYVRAVVAVYDSEKNNIKQRRKQRKLVMLSNALQQHLAHCILPGSCCFSRRNKSERWAALHQRLGWRLFSTFNFQEENNKAAQEMTKHFTHTNSYVVYSLHTRILFEST